jgi:hypothetical protein
MPSIVMMGSGESWGLKGGEGDIFVYIGDTIYRGRECCCLNVRTSARSLRTFLMALPGGYICTYDGVGGRNYESEK